MKAGLLISIVVVDEDEDDRMIIDDAFMQIGYEAEVKKFINGKLLPAHSFVIYTTSLSPAKRSNCYQCELISVLKRKYNARSNGDSEAIKRHIREKAHAKQKSEFHYSFLPLKVA